MSDQPPAASTSSTFPISIFLGDSLSQVLGKALAPAAKAEEPKVEAKKEDDKPVDLGEMKAAWQKLKSGHAADVEKIINKVMLENKTLKDKNEKQALELAVYHSAVKETLADLQRVTKERDTLLTEKSTHAFAAIILDFEADMFLPSTFYREDSARLTARDLRDRVRATLPEDGPAPLTTLVFIFLTRKRELLPDLISEGLFQSAQQLDEWILAFNNCHPLYQIIETDCSPDVAIQRQRALATVLSRIPQCRRLIVGRWALDLPFIELVAPPKKKNDGDKPKEDGDNKGKGQPTEIPDTILFLEPYRTTWVPTEVRKREPKVCSFSGLVRDTHIRRGRGAWGRPVINFSIPLYAQRPPICLDYYLSPSKCTTEACTFSHAYDIPPPVLDAMKFDISRTPCPQMNGYNRCVFGEKCYFAHACPLGQSCALNDEECGFAEHLHPAKTPEPPAPPTPAPAPTPPVPTIAPHQHQKRGAKTTEPLPVPSPRASLVDPLPPAPTSPFRASGSPHHLPGQPGPSQASTSKKSKKQKATDEVLEVNPLPTQPLEPSQIDEIIQEEQVTAPLPLLSSPHKQPPASRIPPTLPKPTDRSPQATTVINVPLPSSPAAVLNSSFSPLVAPPPPPLPTHSTPLPVVEDAQGSSGSKNQSRTASKSASPIATKDPTPTPTKGNSLSGSKTQSPLPAKPQSPTASKQSKSPSQTGSARGNPATLPAERQMSPIRASLTQDPPAEVVENPAPSQEAKQESARRKVNSVRSVFSSPGKVKSPRSPLFQRGAMTDPLEFARLAGAEEDQMRYLAEQYGGEGEYYDYVEDPYNPYYHDHGSGQLFEQRAETGQSPLFGHEEI